MRKVILYKTTLLFWTERRLEEVKNYSADWNKIKFYNAMVEKYENKLDKELGINDKSVTFV